MPSTYDIVEVSPETFTRETGAQLSRDVTKVIWAKDRNTPPDIERISKPAAKRRPRVSKFKRNSIISGQPRVLKKGTVLFRVPMASRSGPYGKTKAPGGAPTSNAKRFKFGPQKPFRGTQGSLKRNEALARLTKKGKKKGSKDKPKSQLELKRYLQPWGQEYPPAVPSLGMYLCVNDLARLQFVHTANSGDFLMVFNPSVAGPMQVFGWQSSGGHNDDFIVHLSPTYAYRTGGPKIVPVAYRPFRGGVQVQNLSAATKREGAIHILNTASPVDPVWNGNTSYDITQLGFAELLSMVTSNPRQKTYTAEQLAISGASVCSYPTSLSAYHSWSPNGYEASTSTHLINQQAWKNGGVWSPMSTIIIVFPNVSENQTYEITTGLQSGQRHHPASMLGSLMKNHTGNGNPSLLATATSAIAADPSAMVTTGS